MDLLTNLLQFYYSNRNLKPNLLVLSEQKVEVNSEEQKLVWSTSDST